MSEEEQGNEIYSNDMSVVRQLFSVDYAEDSPYQSLIQGISHTITNLVSNKKSKKIANLLHACNLHQEMDMLKRDKFLISMNCAYMGLFIGSQFLIKKYITKAIYFMIFMHGRMVVVLPIEQEYIMRVNAKRNTLVGQELRNLYRFYHAGEPFVKQMDQQCEEYLKLQELRKEIQKHRL